MLYIGVLKRVLPFFVTFAAGLFIASFFVSVSSPSVSFPRRGHKFQEIKRLREEVRDLKRTNCELRKQLSEARRNMDDASAEKFDLYFESDAPAPPPPPRAPRRVTVEK